MTPGKQFSHVFYTRNAIGDPLSADSLPIVVILLNGIDTAVPVTVSQLADLSYLFSFTVPPNWSEGSSVQARISATVAGKALIDTANLGHVTLSIVDTIDKVDETWKINGLDPANPMTVTKIQRTVDDITQDITGDCINTSTITRQ